MLRTRILLIMLASAQAVANAQSIPQVVNQLQTDVQALKTKAFSATNSPAPPVFNDIAFFKGYAIFKNSDGKTIINLGAGSDHSSPGIWLKGNTGASANMGVWGNTGQLNL